MVSILLAVADVVDEIGRARQQAEDDEAGQHLERYRRRCGDARRGGCREHEQVLAPLARPARSQERPGGEPRPDRRAVEPAQLAAPELVGYLLDAGCGWD